MNRPLDAACFFLRGNPSLLLPMAANFGELRPVIESAIRGGSMEPAIPRGARLRLRLLCGQPCFTGDVIFYLAGDSYMVHRVLHRVRRFDEEYLLTCGDDCMTPDPPVPLSQVLGTVVAVQKNRSWSPPGMVMIRRFSKRAIRRMTLAAVSGTLKFSVSAARRLAVVLCQLELVSREIARRIR